MKAGSLPGAITVEDILYEQKQKLQLQTNYVRFETQKPAFCDYLLRRIPCYLRMRITQPLAYGRTTPKQTYNINWNNITAVLSSHYHIR